jgi:hypothetical protein
MRTPIRTVALAAVAMAALARPRRAAAQPTVDATHYTVHLTSSETDARGRRTAAPPFVGHVQVAGAPVAGSPILVAAPVRVDIVAGREGFATGDYLLTDPDGLRVLVVSPARRSYREASAADLARQAGRRVRITDQRAARQGGHPGARPADVPGGAASRRVRVERAFALHAKVLFVSQRARITEQTDYWVSDAVRDLPCRALVLHRNDPRRQRRRRGSRPAHTGGRARRAPRRRCGAARGHAGGGERPRGERAETRVTDMRRAPVAAERFVLPAGYRRSDR